MFSQNGEVLVKLFDNSSILASNLLSTKESSRYLAPTIKAQLQKLNLSVSDLSKIVVDAGPGPFTTSRTLVVTANGLSYSSNVPIQKVNHLEALILQVKQQFNNKELIVGVLNGFGGDIFFSVFDSEKNDFLFKDQCLFIEKFNEFAFQFFKNKQVVFLGEGSALVSSLADSLQAKVLDKTFNEFSDEFIFDLANIVVEPVFEIFPIYIKENFSNVLKK